MNQNALFPAEDLYSRDQAFTSPTIKNLPQIKLNLNPNIVTDLKETEPKKIESVEELKRSKYFQQAGTPEAEKEISNRFTTVFDRIRHSAIADKVLLMFLYFKDPNTSKAKKLIIGAGLLYFITPLDFIPDTIPVLGLLDDIGILSMIASYMIDELSAYKEYILSKKPAGKSEQKNKQEPNP